MTGTSEKRRTEPGFRADEDGAALVEFALVLPVFLLFMAVAVEGGRTFWSYQTTITGVRDAARFLSRVTPVDVCETGGSVARWNSRLTSIVRDTRDGTSLFPDSIVVSGVTATLDCASGNYRAEAVPVARVTAELSITYPFSGVFRLFGVTLDTATTYVSDDARVIGL